MISEDDFLQELKTSLASGDLIKAKLVVSHLSGQSGRLQQTIVGILERCEPELAVPVLGEMLDLRIGDLSISRTAIAMIASDKVMEAPLTMTTLSNDAQIHVVTVLGDSNDKRALRTLRSLLVSDPESANLRFTVYEALSKLPLRSGGYVLAAGLEDRDASVRVAAARAIEKNLDDNLLAGIVNMLRDPEPAPAQIAEAIAQAGAMGTLEALLGNDAFASVFGEYLERAPDADFFARVQPLLNASGRRTLAALVDKYLDEVDDVEGPIIYAVDDSSVVLRMYRAALGKTACQLQVFENPYEAIEQVDKMPPDLLFTDLNMPELDGIELAATLRSAQGTPDFPIVMVTTQSYGDDLEKAMRSGVDSFIQKPFKADQLVKAINELTEHAV